MAKTQTKQVVNNGKKVQVKQVVYVPKMEGVVKNLTLKVKYDLKKQYGLTSSTNDKQISTNDYNTILQQVNDKIDILSSNGKYNLIDPTNDIPYIKNHFVKHLTLKTIK